MIFDPNTDLKIIKQYPDNSVNLFFFLYIKLIGRSLYYCIAFKTSVELRKKC